VQSLVKVTFVFFCYTSLIGFDSFVWESQVIGIKTIADIYKRFIIAVSPIFALMCLCIFKHFPYIFPCLY
jgi:hypothetical protein